MVARIDDQLTSDPGGSKNSIADGITPFHSQSGTAEYIAQSASLSAITLYLYPQKSRRLQLHQHVRAGYTPAVLLERQTLFHKLIHRQCRASALLLIVSRSAVDRLIAQLVFTDDCVQKR